MWLEYWLGLVGRHPVRKQTAIRDLCFVFCSLGEHSNSTQVFILFSNWYKRKKKIKKIYRNKTIKLHTCYILLYRDRLTDRSYFWGLSDVWYVTIEDIQGALKKGWCVYIASQTTETFPGQNRFTQNNEHLPHWAHVMSCDAYSFLRDLDHPVKRSSLKRTEKVKFSNIVFRPKSCLVPEITSSF